MELTGIHLLLSYQCIFECDHCFVWGSPSQTGTMSLEHIHEILNQARRLGTVKWIYFEGGEPFLYYPILVKGIDTASSQGYFCGIVTNSYWAIELEDALEWLRPFVGKVQDLSISTDLYHSDKPYSAEAEIIVEAARQLNFPISILSVAQPEVGGASTTKGQLQEGESGLMFRGRAAEKLAEKAQKSSWESFTECPYEELEEPSRVHIDPLGNVHLCQGISLGNILLTPLDEICSQYDPSKNPIIEPLLLGGPKELVQRYRVMHRDTYADACHLCYETRVQLREQFPGILAPDQMYGIYSS